MIIPRLAFARPLARPFVRRLAIAIAIAVTLVPDIALTLPRLMGYVRA